MVEYISRDELKEYINNLSSHWLCSWDTLGVLAAIDAIPSANVRENVTGRWIWDDEGYHCSECLYHAYGNTGEVLAGQFLYCPWCGAKMEVD